ncbi:MAG: 50S ribosomal protein L10 [Dehalococcoidia bacterium]|nr:50S ribosomal protein L10 [Dehalococcoidia bacterium]
MPTARKIALVDELRSLIADAAIAIATSYQGTSVAEQTRLRGELSAAGVQYRVVKNTLLIRAAQAAGRPPFAQLADGPTALVVGHGDPVAAARAITAYLRANPMSAVKIRSAVLGDQLVDAAYVQDLSTVPPRDQLLARLAGGLMGPLVQLRLLLQATTRELAGLIDARAQQLEGGTG